MSGNNLSVEMAWHSAWEDNAVSNDQQAGGLRRSYRGTVSASIGLIYHCIILILLQGDSIQVTEFIIGKSWGKIVPHSSCFLHEFLPQSHINTFSSVLFMPSCDKVGAGSLLLLHRGAGIYSWYWQKFLNPRFAN